ncbi:MAG: histidine kinase dimerization/phosphoacceptor domain-containing protein, partial [Chloroflexi bacterium]|nr:histidine kinase dimerization/phosphoacceptor domain-containing protein [Chloroflexota bacterium]
MRRRTFSGILLVEYAVLVVVGTTVLVAMYENGQPWWLAAPLLLALAVQIAFWPREPYQFLYLAVETALVVGLVALHPFFWALGFSLSATIPSAYPNRFGALWIGLLALMVGVILNLPYPTGRPEDLLSTLVLACGYAGFGYLSYSWTRAEEAQLRTQVLLEDLQEAHRQLRAYADRVEELAVVEERNRLAREMHDTLGHRLTVAAVQLEGAQRLIPSNPDRAARMVGTVREQVREALSEL